MGYVLKLLKFPDDVTSLVAFTAYPASDQTYELDNQLIVFESTHSNFGLSYQALNGIFICPVNGVYLFIVELLSQYGALMYAEIMMDNVVIGRAYTGLIAGTYSHASNSLVMSCDAGSEVWLRTNGDDRRVRSALFSTFSGFMLHQF